MTDDPNNKIKFSEVRELYKSLRNKNCWYLTIGVLTIILAGLLIACGCAYESLLPVILGTIVGFEAVRISVILIYSLIVHKDMYDRLKETYGKDEED